MPRTRPASRPLAWPSKATSMQTLCGGLFLARENSLQRNAVVCHSRNIKIVLVDLFAPIESPPVASLNILGHHRETLYLEPVVQRPNESVEKVSF